MFTALFVSLILQDPRTLSPAEVAYYHANPTSPTEELVAEMQPPAVQTPAPTVKPPTPAPHDWNHWHGRPLVDFRRAFPNVVVVEQAVVPNQVYAVVNAQGVVVQTYTLTPTVAVVPAPVVVEPYHRPRFWWWRR